VARRSRPNFLAGSPITARRWHVAARKRSRPKSVSFPCYVLAGSGSTTPDIGAAYRNRTDDLRITRVFPCAGHGGSMPAPASGSRVAAGGNHWLLTVVRGHLRGTLDGDAWRSGHAEGNSA
jgi:hypothetical protein